jgi:hypothetical protein
LMHHQRRDAHDRIIVLQHCREVTGGETDGSLLGNGEEYWIGVGFAEPADTFRCLRCRTA